MCTVPVEDRRSSWNWSYPGFLAAMWESLCWELTSGSLEEQSVLLTLNCICLLMPSFSSAWTDYFMTKKVIAEVNRENFKQRHIEKELGSKNPAAQILSPSLTAYVPLGKFCDCNLKDISNKA